MTADALAALEALVAKMTAEPWDARGHAIYSPCTPTGRVGMNCGVLADVIREGGQVAVVGTNPKTRPHGEDDAAGIVALRNAAVELIALARDAEALRSEFSSLRDDRDAAMERAEKAERDAEGARKQVEMMEPIYKSWDALAADHAEKSIALHHATQDLAAARALLENARECERRGMRFDRTINAAGETLAARIDSHLSAHPARDAQGLDEVGRLKALLHECRVEMTCAGIGGSHSSDPAALLPRVDAALRGYAPARDAQPAGEVGVERAFLDAALAWFDKANDPALFGKEHDDEHRRLWRLVADAHKTLRSPLRGGAR